MGTLGRRYIYVCDGWNFEDNVNVTWYINGKIYPEDTASNVQLLVSELPSVLKILEIYMTSIENNNTEIFCSVKYSNAQCNSTKSIFRVQGNF